MNLQPKTVEELTLAPRIANLYVMTFVPGHPACCQVQRQGSRADNMLGSN